MAIAKFKGENAVLNIHLLKNERELTLHEFLDRIIADSSSWKYYSPRKRYQCLVKVRYVHMHARNTLLIFCFLIRNSVGNRIEYFLNSFLLGCFLFKKKFSLFFNSYRINK